MEEVAERQDAVKSQACNCKTNRTYIYILAYTLLVLIFSQTYISFYLYSFRDEYTSSGIRRRDNFEKLQTEIKTLEATLKGNAKDGDEEGTIKTRRKRFSTPIVLEECCRSLNDLCQLHHINFEPEQFPNELNQEEESLTSPKFTNLRAKQHKLRIRRQSDKCKCERGPKGEPGEPGLTGLPGFSGAPGNYGYLGVRGPPGEKGERGQPGQPGQPGLYGYPGDAGPSVKGEPGNDGLPGTPGTPGRDGNPGSDAITQYVGGTGQLGPKGRKAEMGAPGPRDLIRNSERDEQVNDTNLIGSGYIPRFTN